MATPLEEMQAPLCFKVDQSNRDEIDPPAPRLERSQRALIRSLSEMQKEAVVTDNKSDDVWRFVSDEGPYLDGADVAPPPLAFFTTGMLCSYVDQVLAVAADREVTVHDVSMVLDNRYGLQGSILRGTMTGSALAPSLEVSIDADADDETLRELVQFAVESSPAYGILSGEHDSLFSLSFNGQQLSSNEASELDGQSRADPRDVFDELRRPTNEQDDPIVRHTGRFTEPFDEADDKYTDNDVAGFADEQDRVIHLRGTCTVRDDGMKHVEQELFSPRGSIFEFLCDGDGDTEAAGGRAPSAAAYLAVGIGFCFMTQLGRYSESVGKNLSEYHIVQDSHFSDGKTRIESGELGEAEPIETHVSMWSDEDEAFAHETLEMSEQTCFLHAVCRTDLEQKIDLTT